MIVPSCFGTGLIVFRASHVSALFVVFFFSPLGFFFPDVCFHKTDAAPFQALVPTKRPETILFLCFVLCFVFCVWRLAFGVFPFVFFFWPPAVKELFFLSLSKTCRGCVGPVSRDRLASDTRQTRV